MEEKTLGDFILVYDRFATAENKSPRTIEAVKQAVADFGSFLGGSTSIETVEAEDLRRYIRHLQGKPKWSGHPTIKQDHGNLSDSAIASYVRSIRSFWSWLKREGFIGDNPFEQVKPPRVVERVVNPLTPAEVSSLLRIIPRQNHAGYRDFCVIMALYGTGLRVGELLTLTLPDLSFDSGQITVVGKGMKERAVYMSASLYRALFKYCSQWRPAATCSYLFIHGDGRPLTRFYVAHRLQHYARKAGLTTRRTPRILRYSFAIQFLRNSGDPFTLQQILGHSTMEMTRHYLKTANSDVEVRMKQYSPAEQLNVRI